MYYKNKLNNKRFQKNKLKLTLKEQKVLDDLKSGIKQVEIAKKNNMIPVTVSQYKRKFKELGLLTETINISEIYKDTDFINFLKTKSVEEILVVSLRLGFKDGKEYSLKEISKIMNIEFDEVIEILDNVFNQYKKKNEKKLKKSLKLSKEGK